MSAATAVFAELMSELDYPMFVVTAAADGERAGCLVGFATETSIHPPRFLACISRKNRTFAVATRAHVLAVHFVSVDDADLAELFGGDTGDEVDKFARTAWRPGPQGVPLIDRLDNWFAGEVCARLDLGDHVGHLLAPIDGAAGRGVRPFTWHRARAIEPGHPA
jgi:flavin reductase (DIM6/NTAB) family NADH-FMN oxidoreductase RutF